MFWDDALYMVMGLLGLMAAVGIWLVIIIVAMAMMKKIRRER